ncbi:MAG: hypothetical protein KKF30_15295 [Proteobacteria bacterium]|nr:hypothetical protein [Pseudomonadota bacterium]MBU4469696.1 hypothetical protein [Pseudomonadota bacterium]MCG2751779.1 hypothetical protein [Desulfobacteraceae bacterium]
MKTIHNINLGFSQQTFDFDQSYPQDLNEILAFIDCWIADNDHAILDEVISHLAIQRDKWSTTYILDSVNTLFKDEKIHFLIAGKKYFPENLQTDFSKVDRSNLKFAQRRETFSVIKTHLSDPDQWKFVEIIKPERIKESDLLRAQVLCEKLFGTNGGSSQNSLCHYLRKHLRKWNSNLEKFRKVSGQEQYPGTNEIQDGLAVTRRLLDVHDPFEFIITFINEEDRLCNAMCNFIILENFYSNQIYTWDILLKAVEAFKQNHADLEKKSDVKKALDTLFTILTDPRPYSFIEEIPILISIVKPVNDLIIEKQIASAKALAFEKIEQIIDKIVNVLNKRNTHSDMRNKTLYPLQSIKRKINAASSMQDITVYLEEAITEFDYAMDRLL